MPNGNANHVHGQLVLARPEALAVGVIDKELASAGDLAASAEIIWPGGVALAGGWIPLGGYERLILHAKPSVAAEYDIIGRQHDQDIDTEEILAATAASANTKVLLLDEDVSLYQAICIRARATGAVGTHRLFLNLKRVPAVP